MAAASPDLFRQLILPAGAGEKFQLIGMTIVVKRPQTDSPPPYTLYEAQIPAYFTGLPAHLHHTTDEWFYLLHGTLAFTLKDETVMVRAGTLISVPAGVAHTFWNPSATIAHLLALQSRPDFAEYLTNLTALLPDIADRLPADQAALWALAAHYDQFPSDDTLPGVLA